jgi:hypothetical protein
MPAAVLAAGWQADSLFSHEAIDLMIPVGFAAYLMKGLVHMCSSSYVLSITELVPATLKGSDKPEAAVASTAASSDSSSELQERYFIAEHLDEWTIFNHKTVFSVSDVVLVQPSMHLLGTFNTCVRRTSPWGPIKDKCIHYIHCRDFHDKELLAEILKRARV